MRLRDLAILRALHQRRDAFLIGFKPFNLYAVHAAEVVPICRHTGSRQQAALLCVSETVRRPGLSLGRTVGDERSVAELLLELFVHLDMALDVVLAAAAGGAVGAVREATVHVALPRDARQDPHG